MTYFPHNPFKRRPANPAPAFASVGPAIIGDILWNRPVFKAPELPNPRISFDPLPFTANRITRRA